MRIAPISLGILGTLLAMAALAPADTVHQHGGPPDLDGTYYLELPPPAGDYTRSEWGDFDADGQEDVASLSGNRLDILFAPGIHEIAIPDISNPEGQGLDVMDFAVVRQPDGRDKLALVDESGLVMLDLSTNEEGLVVHRKELGGFDQAVRLDVWHDGQGKHYAAGMHADGRGIYLADDLEGPWNISPMMFTGAPVPALEMALLDASGRGEAPKVAAIFGNFICYFDPWGGDPLELKHFPGVSYQDMARYRRGGMNDADGLAFLAEYEGAPYFASICDDTISSFQPLDPAQQFYSLRAGRYDTDDLDDLVITGNGSQRLYILLDEASSAAETPSFSFDSDFFHTYQAAPGTAAGQTAQPLLLDADHDGDGDLALALQLENRFWVGRNGTVDAADFMATHDQGAFTPPDAAPDDPPVGAHFYHSWVDRDGDGVDDALEWWIDLEVILPASAPSPYLDVITWKTPLGQKVIDRVPVDVQRIDVSNLEGGTPLRLTLSIDEPGEAIYEDLWLEQVYTIFQFFEADGPNAPQHHCYPAHGIVIAPDLYTLDPPHVPVDIWAISKDIPGHFLSGNDPLPNGSGDDTDCVPADNPPQRKN